MIIYHWPKAARTKDFELLKAEDQYHKAFQPTRITSAQHFKNIFSAKKLAYCGFEAFS